MAESSVATTGIDGLVIYLKEHGESDTISLAEALKVDQTVIEEWAKILEKANIVKISYRMGKMYIAPLVAKPEQVQTLKEEIEVKKGTLESEINAQVITLDQISKKIDELSKVVNGGEEVFKKKSPTLKKSLDELNKLQKEAESKFKSVENIDNHINMIAKKMDEKLKGLQEHALHIEKITTDTSDSEKIIEDIKNKVTLAEKSIGILVQKFDETVKAQRNELNKLIESMKTEIKILSENADRQEEELRETDRMSAEYKKEVEEMRRALEKESTHILNEIAKSKEEVDSYYKLAKEKFDNFSKELDAASKSFGDLSQLDKKFIEIKDQLSSTKAEMDEILKELHKLDAELKAITSITEQNVASNSMKIGEIGDKISENASKVNALGNKVNKINKDISDIAGEDSNKKVG